MLQGWRRHGFAAAVGMCGGGCVGLVGWGGAQFIIPGMTHPLMGHSQLAATGISLCSLSLSTATSATKFLMDESADIGTAAAIAVPSILSARLGTRLAARIPDTVLQLTFNGLSLLFIPLHFLVQRHAASKRGAAHESVQPADSSPSARPQRAEESSAQPGRPVGLLATLRPQDVAFGCLSGAVSALMGVGGLPLTMSYLTLCADLPHHLMQGTAVLAVAPSILTSALSRFHAVPVVTAAAVTAGAMTGAMIGASVALRIPEDTLRELFMASLVILGGRSFIRAGYNIKSLWASWTKG